MWKLSGSSRCRTCNLVSRSVTAKVCQHLPGEVELGRPFLSPSAATYACVLCPLLWNRVWLLQSISDPPPPVPSLPPNPAFHLRQFPGHLCAPQRPPAAQCGGGLRPAAPGVAVVCLPFFLKKRIADSWRRGSLCGWMGIVSQGGGGEVGPNGHSGGAFPL